MGDPDIVDHVYFKKFLWLAEQKSVHKRRQEIVAIHFDLCTYHFAYWFIPGIARQVWDTRY
jgi:hypothetical protein